MYNYEYIEITIEDWDRLPSHERYTDYNESGNLTFYQIVRGNRSKYIAAEEVLDVA